jgi:hypothetical protein
MHDRPDPPAPGKTEATEPPSQERRPWRAPQFMFSDLSDTDTGGASYTDGLATTS